MKRLVTSLVFLAICGTVHSGVMIEGGKIIEEWEDDDGDFYALVPQMDDPGNMTGDQLMEASSGRGRPGRASMTHTCNRIRGVPSALRSGRNIGPRGLGYFYRKYTEAYGIPIVGSHRASDDSLKRSCYIARYLLAGHSKIRYWFYKNSGRFAVIGVREGTTHIPEHSFLPAWWNTRARGLGATISAPVSSAGEENFLCLTQDRYRAQDIGLHEYAHGVHLLGAVYGIRGWDSRLRRLYASHLRTGRWARTYSTSTKEELFAEGTQSYFNVNSYSRVPDGVRGPINTRTKLRAYDPTLYRMIQEVFPCDNPYIKRCEKNRAKEQAQVLKMNCDLGNPVTSAPVVTGVTSGTRVTKTPVGTTTRICMNIHDTDQCEAWAARGECGKNPTWMLKNCNKACKKCERKGPCSDNNRSCRSWAEQYCNDDMYESWMKENCRKSCKICT